MPGLALHWCSIGYKSAHFTKRFSLEHQYQVGVLKMCSLLQQHLRDHGSPALLKLDQIAIDACLPQHSKTLDTFNTGYMQDCTCKFFNGTFSDCRYCQVSEGTNPCARFAEEVFKRAKQCWVPVPPYSIIYEGYSARIFKGGNSESSGEAFLGEQTSLGTTDPPREGISIGTKNAPRQGIQKDCISGLRVISSAALTQAAFNPCLLNLLSEVCVESNEGVPLVEIGKGSMNITWVRPSYLKPNLVLSDALREWGNDALKRGHMLVAEYLYVVATCLLPSCEEVDSNSNCSCTGSGLQGSALETPCLTKARLAILNSNRSLVLLRLGRVGAALRLATEAVLSDPFYRKAWYRRSCALEQLLLHATDSASDSPENDRWVKCLIKELKVARENAVATSNRKRVEDAQHMYVGRCGCYHCDFPATDASNQSVSACHENKNNYSERHIWTRSGVTLQRGSKGNALVWNVATGERGSSGTQAIDESLVLEEDAIAFYVNPPSFLSSCLPFTVSTSSEGCEILKLHHCDDVRHNWERCVEHRATSETNSAYSGYSLRFSGECELSAFSSDSCAGCGTVVGARVAEVSFQNETLESKRDWLQSTNARPLVLCVPCGSCASVLFCCKACRDSSLHTRFCRKAVASLTRISVHQAIDSLPAINRNRRTLKENKSTVEPHSRALAFEDPQRHIAWQLLNMCFASADDGAKYSLAFIGESSVGASGEAALTASGDSRSLAVMEHPQTNDVSWLKEVSEELVQKPFWLQVYSLSAAVALTPQRIVDCLVNAAWLAGAKWASDGAHCCGKRCIICAQPINAPLNSTSVGHPVQGDYEEPKKEVTSSSCDKCCECCRYLCTNCGSNRGSNVSSSSQSARFSDYPKCLLACAVHVYVLACQNSFKMRVSMDPEDDAVAVGTAFYLIASRLNHSCVPNALATFGQCSSVACGNQGSRHGCAPHLQVRITDLHAISASTLNKEGIELCISYGPVAGEDDGSWASRQRWLSRNASFNCLCEACTPPEKWETMEERLIKFSKELFDGVPCPKCILTLNDSQVHTKSEMARTLGENALEQVASIVLSCAAPETQQAQQLSPRSAHGSAEVAVDMENLVGELARLLLKRREEASEQWTTPESLAVLGHSCFPVWKGEEPMEIEPPDNSSRSMYKYMNFDEYFCVNCTGRYPKVLIQELQTSVMHRVDSLCKILNEDTEHLANATTPQAVELFVDRIRRLVNITGGIMKTCGYVSAELVHTFRELSRAYLAQYRVYRAHSRVNKATESIQCAALYLSSACYLQQLRLPMGLHQPELVLPLYRLGMLLCMCNQRDQAVKVLCLASKTAGRAFGPNNICTQSLLKHLKWLRSFS